MKVAVTPVAFERHYKIAELAALWDSGAPRLLKPWRANPMFFDHHQETSKRKYVPHPHGRLQHQFQQQPRTTIHGSSDGLPILIGPESAAAAALPGVR
jgi:hypothetical protein